MVERSKIINIVLFALITILIGVLIINDNSKRMKIDKINKENEQYIDSIRMNQIKIDQLNEEIIRLDSIIKNTEYEIIEIKYEYIKQVDIVSNYNTNESFNFFSGWLPKDDSVR